MVRTKLEGKKYHTKTVLCVVNTKSVWSGLSEWKQIKLGYAMHSSKGISSLCFLLLLFLVFIIFPFEVFFFGRETGILSLDFYYYFFSLNFEMD